LLPISSTVKPFLQMKRKTKTRKLCLRSFTCKCPYVSVFGVLSEGVHVFIIRTVVAGRGSLQLQLVPFFSFFYLSLFISYSDLFYLLTARAEDYYCSKLRSMAHTHIHTQTHIHTYTHKHIYTCTHKHTYTIGRTTLDEGSVCRSEVYLIT